MWANLIVLALFGVIPWWIAIPGAVIGQSINGFILLGIFRLTLGSERYRTMVSKAQADRLEGKPDWDVLQ
jgi:hypothetical protein